MMKKIDVLMSYLLIILVLGLSTVFAWDTKKLERTFSVNSGGVLILESDIGSIEVEATTKDEVKVVVLREFKGWDEEEIEDFLEDFTIDFEQKAADVEVTARLRGRRKNMGKNVRIRFMVEVPQKYNVDLKTAGGSISVKDLEGKVDAHTSGGSLSFGKIRGIVNGKTSGGSISLQGSDGDAFIKTSGGSISIGEVGGNVDAHTSGGSISIERANGEVIAKTSGGSINIEEVMGSLNASTSGGSVTAHITKQPKSDCRLNTSGGSINIYLPRSSALSVDAKTGGGRVECDFDILVKGARKKNQLRGEINGGGPELYLRTSGSNIYIHEK